MVIPPPDEAARVANETLEFFDFGDFGDFGDILDRARTFVTPPT